MVRPTSLLETVLACAVLCLLCASAQASSCSLQSSGTTYDLSPLTKGLSDVAWTAYSNNGLEFQLNVCGPVPTSTSCSDPNAGACVLSGQANYTLGSALNSSLSFVGADASQGIVLRYWGGLNNYNSTSPTANDGTCHSQYDRETTILFTCGVGLGSPVFVYEDEKCNFLFQWPTSLACTPPPVGSPQTPCTVFDPSTGHLFDLSSLIRTSSNWIVEDEVEGNYFAYFLNVCEPLVAEAGVTGDCATGNSAACQTVRQSSSDATKSLGQVSAPYLQGDNIVISLSTGSICSANSTASLDIIFNCDPLIGLGHPAFLESDDCSFTFTWSTSAACPLNTTQSNGCQVASPLSGEVFSLSSLSTSPATVTANGAQYSLAVCAASSLCGTIGGVTSAACQVQTGNNINLGQPSDLLTWQDGQLSLTYTGGSACNNGLQKISTTVIFVCNPNATNLLPSVPYLAHSSGCEYVFEYPTALACAKEQLECIATGPAGEQYDLSSLSLNDGNWAVTVGSTQYQINVCRPVVGTSCPANSGICSIAPSSSGTSIIGLGTPTAEPSFDSNGNLILQYPNPSTCGNGTTVITFSCSPDTVGEPQFVSADPANCRVDFIWASSAACPNVIDVGSNCKVTDLLSGFVYDLSSLRNSTTDYVVTNAKNTYHLNLCGPLVSYACGSNTSAAACQSYVGSTSITNITLGYASSALTLNDGQVTLTYNGGKTCLGGKNRTVLYNFICDPFLSGAQGPDYVSQTLLGCTYVFNWRTKLVCSKVTEVSCLVDLPASNVFVDLTPLRRSSANWIVADPTSGSTFAINMCQNLVGDDTGCPLGSAACQVDSSGVPKSIGRLAPPQYDPVAQVIYVEYDNGLPGCNGQASRTTRIDFVCNPDAGLGAPQFVYLDQGCNFKFEWQTSTVCPQHNTSSGFCYTSDPISGQKFDLSALELSTGLNSSNPSYTLNVCGTVACGNTTNAGGCYRSGTTIRSLGQSSGSVQLVNGVLTLNYLNGDKCPSGNLANTTILFVCSGNTTSLQLNKVDNTNCQYKFIWKTPLACPDLVDSVSCQVGGYDLSPLINNNGNWLATDNGQGKYQYQINVCRTLVPGYGNCSEGMSSCQTTPNNTAQGDFDAGRLLTSPQLDSNGNLYILYPSGQICGNTYLRSTLINFVCPRDSSNQPIPGIIGHPTFVMETAQCQYVFQWITSFACPVSDIVGANCQVTDDSRGDVFNLSPLSQLTSNYAVTVGTNKFYMNVCLPVNSGACGARSGTIGACEVNVATGASRSLGAPTDALSFSEGSLLLKYTGGDPCANSAFTRTTIIEFVCDPNSTPGSSTSVPNLIESDNCTFIFEWRTSLACTNTEVVQCLAYNFTTAVYYDLSSLVNSRQNWLSNDIRPDGSTYTYELNVCRTLVPDPNFPNCPPNAAACQVAQVANGFQEQSTGQVSSPQIAADGHVFLLYSNGYTCPGTNVQASTRIDFYCPKSTSAQNGPVFIGETSQCQYQFSWTTPAACAIPMNTVSTTVAPSLLTCEALDYDDNYVFNLKPIQGIDIVAAIDVNSGVPSTTEIHLSMCGTTELCPAAVCMINPDGTATSFGKYYSDPVYVDSTLTMTYINGDSCGNGQQIESVITLVCDPTNYQGSVVYMGGSIDNCTQTFVWKTPYACLPSEMEVPCLVTDPVTGKQYDLTPLMRTNGSNWIASAHPTSTDYYNYQINVCHTLLPFTNVQGSQCSGAGACQTKPSDPNFLYSVGMISSPQVKNGALSLHYTIPNTIKVGLCRNSYTRSMVINFVCAPDSLGEPVFQTESLTCQYNFLWQTSAACSITQTVGSNCRVRDPTTNLAFDLTGLSQQDFSTTSGGNTYMLHVCGALSNSSVCGNGTAGCITDASGNSYSLGQPSSALTLDDTSLTLSYASGDACTTTSGTAGTRSTKIQFVCQSDADVGAPILETTDGCSSTFRWPTNYACTNHQQIQCNYADPNTGLTYDLSDLSTSTSNWVAQNPTGDKATYIVSVCHSLLPQVPSTGCPLGSGICQANGTHEYSLGSVSSLTVETNTLVAYYDNGNSTYCPSGHYRNSKITFTCGPSLFAGNSLGLPVFVNESTLCAYNFQWQTPAACPSIHAVGSNCKLTNPTTAQAIDLNALGGRAWEVIDPTGNVFNITTCGALSGDCGGVSESAVCKAAPGSPKVSAGQENTTIILDDNLITVTYWHGSLCEDGVTTRSTTISFVCQPCLKAGAQGPSFLNNDGNDCAYSFLWPTELVCSPDQQANCSSTSTTSTTHTFSTQSTIVYSTTTEFAPVTTNAPTKSPSSSGSKTTAIAASLGVIGIVILAVAAFLVWRKIQKTKVQYASINNDLFAGADADDDAMIDDPADDV